MYLELAKIIRTEGYAEPFSVEMDFSDMEFGGSFPVPEPVRADGTVKNTAGVLEMDGEVSTRLHGVCDRCAKQFLREYRVPFHAILETDSDSAQSDDLWTFPVSGTQADLDDIVRTAFVLNMESKMLCKQDCKGLCCRCGADLNEGPCDCKPEIDPRFAVLQQLFQKD